MLNYRVALEIEGTIARQMVEFEDQSWQRWKALDALIASRMRKQMIPPTALNLLYASADGQKPALSGIFRQVSLLNGINDLWNALVKEPIDPAVFTQIVDENPGLHDTARVALEKSLLRVSPFSLDAFEELLEVQEQVYDTRIFSGVLLDRHGRLDPRNDQSYLQKRSEKQKRKASLFIEAVVRAAEDGPHKKITGCDVKVQSFSLGLQGVAELFTQWDVWLNGMGRTPQRYQRIYVYSHLKGLLPACWEQLRQREVAAEHVRLPQWLAYSNAIAGYMEFLVADVERCAFIFLAMNGNCHFAEWSRHEL